MKRYKLAAALLTALLSISPIVSATATAAPNLAGSKCTKLSQTKTASGKKFTCVKIGGKLVWNKGTAIKPITKPIAKPTPTPTTEPTAPSQPLSFDNLDTKWVRKIAYAEINKGVAASQAFTPNITFVIGPSLTQARVDQEKAGLNRSSNFWSELYQPSKVFIGYYTEKDVDWVDAAMCQQARYCPSGYSPVISKVIKESPNSCNSAQATTNGDGIPFFNQCLGSGSDEIKNRQTGPHEYFHWVQAAFVNWSSVPNWFVEGSADYFGDALGIWDGTSLPTNMDQMQFSSSYNWTNQDLCPLANPTVEKIVNCFKYTYRQGTPPGQGSRWMLAHVSYYMGSQATEAMLAVKGLAVYKEFLRDLKNGSFDSIFAKHYGLTVDEFYPKVAKYVLEMYQQRR